jgi:hypothetical protein
VVTLTATPTAPSVFTGWSGACVNISGPCSVTMDVARSVTANFSGVASITSLTEETRYWPRTVLPSTADGMLAVFNGLATGVAGYSNTPIRTASLKRNADLVAGGSYRDVGYRYRFTLNVTGGPSRISFVFSGDFGAGGGLLIDSQAAAVSCGDQCGGAQLAVLDRVLTAGQHVIEVVGFEDCCDGGSSATLRQAEGAAPVDVATLLPAVAAYPLAVTTTGPGRVTSNPGGIDCGANCTYAYAADTKVRLTATPTPGGNFFAGWSGACAGTGLCEVTVLAAKSVNATFSRPLIPLSVTLPVTGGGSVTSTPAGITCGTLCTATFQEGTTVTLMASPAPGYAFDGWSGACSGTSPCVLTLSTALAVSPRFRRLSDTTPPTLSCHATPEELWPVDHKMWDIRINVSAVDPESGTVGYTLRSVVSSEPSDAKADGKSVLDIDGWATNTPDVTGQLRAERAGTQRDRVYTFTYSATDNAGNTATTSCTVVVPHDAKK